MVKGQNKDGKGTEEGWEREKKKDSKKATAEIWKSNRRDEKRREEGWGGTE